MTFVVAKQPYTQLLKLTTKTTYTQVTTVKITKISKIHWSSIISQPHAGD